MSFFPQGSSSLWGLSSVGRAPALQAGGQGFDPPSLHKVEILPSGRIFPLSLKYECLTEPVKGPQSHFSSIENKCGHPVGYWFELLSAHKHKPHMAMVSVLKVEHGLGHGHTNALVAFCRAKNLESAQSLHANRLCESTETPPLPLNTRLRQ